MGVLFTFTQPGMSQTWCKFWILLIWFASLSSSCIKSVTMRLMQLDIGWLAASQLWIKSLDKWQSTCIKPDGNLQQTCYLQAGASDTNTSWCGLDVSKSTLTRGQLETCWLWVKMKITSRTTVIKWVIIYLGKMSNWLFFVTRSMHLFRVLFVTIIEVPNFIIPA